MDTNSIQAIAELIRSRRSVDRFRPELPSPALVREAIELARWAPNHRLTEPWHFYLCGPKTREAIIDLNAEIVAAKQGPAAAQAKRARWAQMPGYLVMTCDSSTDPLRAQEDYAACACAAQNLMLGLWAHGIGSKWTSGDVTRDRRLYDLIWVDPDQETIVGLFWYGYPETLPGTTRKDVTAITVELP